jgi:hypothetical protein
MSAGFDVHSAVIDRRYSYRCPSSALAAEHDLIAFGVGTEGKVGWFAGLVGHRLVAQDTSGGYKFGGSGKDIGDLEGEAGPGSFVLPTAVDAEGGAGDVELSEVFVLAGDFRAEERGVESHGSGKVLGPDDVFEAFDGHFEFMKAAREEMPQLNLNPADLTTESTELK